MSLGGWSIERVVVEKIHELIEPGDTILEFGSGHATPVLADDFDVFSIEHKEDWLGKYDSTTYIFAPTVDGWYDPDYLKGNLPDDYDLILVDGPIGKTRANFVDHTDLFDLSVPLIFDDTNRDTDREAAERIASIVDRDITFYDGESKQFAVV